MRKLYDLAAWLLLIGGGLGVFAFMFTNDASDAISGTTGIAFSIAIRQLLAREQHGVRFVINVSELDSNGHLTGRELVRKVYWRMLPRSGEYLALDGNEHEVRKVSYEMFNGARVHIDVDDHDFQRLSLDKGWAQVNFN